MAKRETPEFNPTRIVQPTASPVETFVQPFVQRPKDPTGGMQVAEALSGLSSSLSGLGEDLLLARKQQDIAAGEAEDLSKFTPAQLREYEEKAGGILPWRYQAALNSYGMRQAEQNYQSELFQRLPELADPINLDGTPKTEAQVYQEMNKVWEGTMSGVTGYYARAGAAQSRKSSDALFLNMWGQQRRQNIIRNNEEALQNTVVEALETGADAFSSMENINAIQEAYRSTGLGTGREVVLRTVTGWVGDSLKFAGPETNFDGMRASVMSLKDNGIGGPLNTTQQEVMDTLLEQIDYVETKALSEDASQKNLRADAFTKTLVSQALTEVTNTKAASNGRFMNMSMPEINNMAARLIAGGNVPDDLIPLVQGQLVLGIRGAVTEANKEVQPNPQVFRDLIVQAEAGQVFAPIAAMVAFSNGEISEEQRQSILRTFEGVRSVNSIVGSGGVQRAIGASFEGALPEKSLYPPEVFDEMSASSLPYAKEAENRANAEIAGMMANVQDPYARQTQAQEIIARHASEAVQRWRTANQQTLDNESHTAVYDKVMENEETNFTALIDRYLENTIYEGEDFTARTELLQDARARIRNAVSSTAGRVTDRIRTVREAIPAIVDEAIRARNQQQAATSMPTGRGEPEIVPALADDPRLVDLAKVAAEATDGTTAQGAEVNRIRARYVADAVGRVADIRARLPITGVPERLSGSDRGADWIEFTEFGIKDNSLYQEYVEDQIDRGLADNVRSPSIRQGWDRIWNSTSGAVNSELTREYYRSSAQAGEIGLPELVAGKTRDGLSIAFALAKGDLDVTVHPLFANAKELMDAMDLHDASKGTAGPLAVLQKNASGGSLAISDILRNQQTLLMLYQRASADDFAAPIGQSAGNPQ